MAIIKHYAFLVLSDKALRITPFSYPSPPAEQLLNHNPPFLPIFNYLRLLSRSLILLGFHLILPLGINFLVIRPGILVIRRRTKLSPKRRNFLVTESSVDPRLIRSLLLQTAILSQT
jgi:hypothetical protein